VKGTITHDTTTVDATPAALQEVVASKTFFWLDLDLDEPNGDADVSQLLSTTFAFHPLAVDAAMKFGQRPRIDPYDDFVHIVTFGMAADSKDVVEVHCFVTEQCIISLHKGDCPALASVHSRIETYHVSSAAAKPVAILYLIMDTLIDSFFPVLAAFDDDIDDLEADILKNPTEDQLGTLFAMKRQLLTIRKVVSPQRDMVSALNSGLITLPGMTDAGQAYYRSLYDHLIRIGDMIDSYRDLVSGATDTHLSMVSNRLNVVMKQLAVIATVFLPLGFLTGFFGQNFAWPITHIMNSKWNFFALGLGTEVIAIALLMVLFKRRGWLGGPTA
jgi:magnesium transporter